MRVLQIRLLRRSAPGRHMLSPVFVSRHPHFHHQRQPGQLLRTGQSQYLSTRQERARSSRLRLGPEYPQHGSRTIRWHHRRGFFSEGSYHPTDCSSRSPHLVSEQSCLRLRRPARFSVIRKWLDATELFIRSFLLAAVRFSAECPRSLGHHDDSLSP